MTEKDITLLPLPEDMTRMESGVVQFGDDWPGIFLRGDSAFGMASTINSLIEGDDTGLFIIMGESARDFLLSCTVDPSDSK